MSIGVEECASKFQAQKDFFLSGNTLGYRHRIDRLRALKKVVRRREDDILDALSADMDKPIFEAFGSELAQFFQELDHTLRWLKDWMRSERKSTSLLHFPSSTHVTPTPKGQVLILGPWNYPFLLLMNPLVMAVAAGNTAMLKLPKQTPATAAIMDEICAEVFPAHWVSCLAVDDEDIIPRIIEPFGFDHIFFTGSDRVGKLIMTAAATTLTPVTLELGGKSPTIVAADANLEVAARRIIWAKGFNAGQTCIAPDHVLVHAGVKERFLDLLKAELNTFMRDYGGLKGFTRIIHYRHFENLVKHLDGQASIYGGDLDADELKIGLTLVDNPALDSSLMQEEIFGPILPVLTWSDETELHDILDQNPMPLALYLFGKDSAFEERMLSRRRFGGGCVNNCLIQFTANGPFGGLRRSGIGAYHGDKGFRTFSHYRTVVRTGTWLDIPIRYAPYKDWKTELLRRWSRL